VTRQRAPHDGRGCVVELTPAGRALVRRARARKIAWVRQALAGVDGPDLAALERAADALDRRPALG
jgi:DNA-binding MarR family transcriptional regulator